MALLNNKRIERAVKLDKTVYKEIRDDKNGFTEGLTVMLCAALIGGIWNIVGSQGLALIGIIIFTPLGLLIGGGILHLLAKALGGKATYKGYLAALGYANAPNALGIVPILGTIVGGIWSFVLTIYATKDAHELSMGKAIIVVIIPLIIATIIAFILAVLFAAVFMSAIRSAGPGFPGMGY